MNKFSSGTRIAVALSLFALNSSVALSASFKWTFVKDSKLLIGMEQVLEGDYAFRAECKTPQNISLGIGADKGVGKSEGEAVHVTLTLGTTTSKLSGKSARSSNYEMTGSTELQAKVTNTHALFSMLTKRGTINVTGAVSENWPEKGRATATRAFLAACMK